MVEAEAGNLELPKRECELLITKKIIMMTKSPIPGTMILSFMYVLLLLNGSSPASHDEQRPCLFLLKGVVHDTMLTVKCT